MRCDGGVTALCTKGVTGGNVAVEADDVAARCGGGVDGVRVNDGGLRDAVLLASVTGGVLVRSGVSREAPGRAGVVDDLSDGQHVVRSCCPRTGVDCLDDGRDSRGDWT